MITNACGIYKITNTITGDYYIGSSCYLKNRLSQHRSALKSGTHSNQHLQRAWNKYGSQSFVFEHILLCDIDTRLYYEQVLLDSLKPHYNIATCAMASAKGLKRSAETRRKMSEANKGKTISEESRRISRITQTGNTHALGYKHTEEAKRKMSEANKGKRLGTHLSEETKRKIGDNTRRCGNHRAGVKLSEETKRKMSEAQKSLWTEEYKLKHRATEEHLHKLHEANKGRHHTEETKCKLSEINKGKHMSEEAKRKMSEAHKGKHLSDETKRKQSEALKGRKLSEEQKLQIIACNTGRIHTEEARRHMSEAHKGLSWSEARRQAEIKRRGGNNI